MKVEFAENKLRECYEDADEAVRRFGAQPARKYVRLVNTLYNAKSLDDIRPIRSYHLHELKGKRKGEHALTLHDKWRVVLVALNEEETSISIEEVSVHYGD